MHYLIFATTICLTLTKLADVLSTLKHIRGAQHESNRLARQIMQRIGIAPTVWLIFGIALGIIMLSTFMALQSHWLVQLAFVLVGLFVSLVQGAVAHYNMTQRENQIIRLIRRMLQAWYGRA